MSTLYSIGQMNQLGDALEVAGFAAEDVTKLKQFANLVGILNVLHGLCKIEPIAGKALRVITIDEKTIVVNLGANPYLPFDGAEVEQHIGQGWTIVSKGSNGLYVNGHKVVLHLSKRQYSNSKCPTGHELREELTGKPILNTNVLDALYENTHLIPEDWKKDKRGNPPFISFWATVYRDATSHGLYVNYLYFSFEDGRWHRFFSRLDYICGDGYPAALLANN